MIINWILKHAPSAAWFNLLRGVDRRLDRSRAPKEEAVLAHVQSKAERGNPASVLDAIDDFASHQRWMMNIGPRKGQVLTQALTDVNAKNVLEIGAYCGYSATLIGQFLKPRGGHLISIEKNGRFAAVAREVVAHAGLADTVEIRVSTLQAELGKQPGLLPGPFDAVLLDHWKDEYLPDLQRLEKGGMLRNGTAVIADNVGFFAVPEYLGHVRESGLYHSTYYESSIEYTDHVKDGVEVSIYRS